MVDRHNIAEIIRDLQRRHGARAARMARPYVRRLRDRWESAGMPWPADKCPTTTVGTGAIADALRALRDADDLGVHGAKIAGIIRALYETIYATPQSDGVLVDAEPMEWLEFADAAVALISSWHQSIYEEYWADYHHAHR